MLLELLARPPLRWRRGLGLRAGTLSFGCPLFWWCDESFDVTTESFPPLSHSPSSVLLSLVSAQLQQFVMKGCVFPLWPALATCLPVSLLPPSFYKGALLPPIQSQNKYGFGIPSLTKVTAALLCQLLSLPSRERSMCFLPWFLFISPPFPLRGNEGGRDPSPSHQALHI